MSETKSIDCSICKLTFDEDHGVWVCLECTEKLTNAIHQASISPQPPKSIKKSIKKKQAAVFGYSHSPKVLKKQRNNNNNNDELQYEERRSSLPSNYNINNINNNNNNNSDNIMDNTVSMTLFLELTNNGNKRRFKYKPNDLHKNILLIEMKENLLKRFSHDFDLKKLIISSKQISNFSSFEINDKQYQHQFIILETLNDLFDGAKIKININKYYYNKYKMNDKNNNDNKKTSKILRRRSKSASSINDDFKSSISPIIGAINHEKKEKNIDLKIETKIIGKNQRLKRKWSINNDGNDIISPKYHEVDQLHNNPSYDIMDKYGLNAINAMNTGSFHNECIIIDNGSGLIKCGFGGLSDNKGPHGPQIVFPTCYFKPPSKYNNIEIGNAAINIIDKLSLYNTSSLIKPIHRGFITNWNEMEYIWNDILSNKLRKLFLNNTKNNNNNDDESEYNLSDHPLLMTERYKTPYKDREKLLEIMFESFDIPSLYLAHSACLSIYGTGRTKGIVLDIGDGITSVIAMFERVTLSQNIGSKVIEFGGYDITRDIMKEYNLSSYLHANIIKERYYSVPYDRSDILFADQNKSIYKLPDGAEIKLGKNRMIKPLHFMFDKSTDNKYGGINVSQLVTNCIKSNDIDIQNLLWKNIVLSGGTTMMDGFAEKFAKEIKHLTPVKTQVIAGRSRRYLSWVGAVVMSSIGTFKNISISRSMYQQHGPRVVREIKL